jgi:hypothetical protein
MILAMLFMVMLDKTEHPATTQNPVLMRTKTAFAIVRAIHEVDAQRRRRYRGAICHLIRTRSTLLLLIPRRHRRVLPYTMSEFHLDDYPDK